MIEAKLHLQYHQQCVLSELAGEIDGDSRLGVTIEEMHDHQVTLIVDIGRDSGMERSRDFLSKHPKITNFEQLDRTSILVTKPSCGAYSAVYRNGGTLWRQNYITDEKRIYTVLVFQREQLEEIIASFRDYSTVLLGKLRQVSNLRKGEEGQGASYNLLTDRQHEVLKHAWERGYFQWPRDIKAEELADDLDISRATLAEHLRKAQNRLINEMMESTEHENYDIGIV